MSSTKIKTEIHQIIDQLDDPFLKVVHSMLDTYLAQQQDIVIGYDLEGNPVKASIAKKKYEVRKDSIMKGNFSTIDEVEKESIKW